MVRAAAKNYDYVTILTSPKQYAEFLDELNKNNGSTSLEFRKMSQIAFSETTYYDLISNYFNDLTNNYFPEKTFHSKIVEKLRYGENPHQESAIYTSNDSLKLRQLNGKQLSYNNYNDIFLPNDIKIISQKHWNCHRKTCKSMRCIYNQR